MEAKRVNKFVVPFAMLALFLFLLIKVLYDPQDTAAETSLDGSVFVSVYGNYEKYSFYCDETGHYVSSNNILTDYLFAGYRITSDGLNQTIVGLKVYGEQSSFWSYDERSSTFYVLITQIAETKAKGHYAPVPLNAKAECWIGPLVVLDT